MVIGMAKRTYVMPDETALRFENAVAPGERSKVVGMLIQEWLDEKQRAETRAAVIEGCREMGDVYLADTREWLALDEETWRAL